MFVKRRFIKQDEAGDGTSTTDTGGTQTQTAAPDNKALLAEIATLRATSATLLDEKKKLQKQYEGIDVDKIRAMQAHFDSSEEAKLIAEGKLDEVLNLRFAKKDADTTRQIEEAKAEVTKAKEYATRFNARLMQGEVRAAAPADLHPSALELAQLLAEKVFSLDDEGNTVPKDGAMGKSGKAPYSLKEWYEDLRGTHPTLFVNGNTGSSSFQGAGKGGAKTMSREKFEATPLHQRHEIIASGIQIVDR